MKKILIVSKNLCIGGIETSLINLLNNTNDLFEIDLFLFSNEGDLFPKVPESVNLVECPKNLKSYGIAVKHNKVVAKVYSVLQYFGVASLLASFNIKKFKQKSKDWCIEKEYDLAISYHGLNVICNQLVLDKVKAKKKMCLVHSDVSKICLSSTLKKQYKLFDTCLTCSKSVAKNFADKLKGIKKVDVLYNSQDKETLMNYANVQCENIKKDKICMCMVGRLNQEKGPLRLLKVLNKLNKANLKFDFYFMGDGPLKDDMENYVKKHSLSNIHFLGALLDFSKYLKQCDLFVLPSFHEAAPMVFAESMMLGVPVVTTKTCSAKELVGDLGFVCDNSFKGIYDTLNYLLTHNEEIAKKKELLKTYDWDNERIRNKLVNLAK